MASADDPENLAGSADPFLAAHGLVAGFAGQKPVLHGASLPIWRGRRVALLGANGSGKTTLLRCLSGAHQPHEGWVRFDGQQLRHSRDGLRRHRQRVQLVLQDPDDQLFSASVAQDVSFGPVNQGLPEAQARRRVAEALATLEISHLADRATHHLSFGERKRVATAGAVAMNPDVLLLDEPTAGLDPHGVGLMLAALARLHAAGTTLVVATHDVALALAWADEAALVLGGRVVHGPVAELLSNAVLLSRCGLVRPWPLELAARLGLPGQPRDLEQLIELLPKSAAPAAAGPESAGPESADHV